MNKHHIYKFFTHYKKGFVPRNEAGFTILELLIVVAILAVVAGSMMLKQGDTTEKAKVSMAISEMNNIKKALLQYRLDMRDFSLVSQNGPADFKALYEDPRTTPPVPPWNPDIGRGWRGPYLTALGEGHTDIGDSLQNNGTGSPEIVVTAQVKNIRSVADTFTANPVLPNSSYIPCVENAGNTNCLFDWRTLADDSDTDDNDGDKAHDRHGRPYLLFDLTPPGSPARLVSMGLDGRYKGFTCTSTCDTCVPNGPPPNDDLLVCLLR